MDTKDIEQLVHRILSKKQILSYGNDLLCLFTPSLDLEVEADLVYRDAYESNLYSDYLLEEDLKQFLIGSKILPVTYDSDTEKLEKTIDLLGKETKPQTNTPFIEIYDDGTVEKRIFIE